MLKLTITLKEPKLKDVELLAMDFISEYMSIDSECWLFRIIPEVLSSKIERSVIIEESENYSLQWHLLGRNFASNW